MMGIEELMDLTMYSSMYLEQRDGITIPAFETFHISENRGRSQASFFYILECE